jgi:N-acetylglucosaminyldiphosphoundecaprenol N-acetyl-beta-D-mannosaminyltransferase
MTLPPRFNVLGVLVSAVDLRGAVDVIHSWVNDGKLEYVCVTGVHGVIESIDKEPVLQAHRSAGLVVADGMPLVWAGHYAGYGRQVGHVRGADLMQKTLDAAECFGWSCFFYGGAPGVADQLVKKVLASHPRLIIQGTLCPPYRPLTPQELDEHIEKINAAAPTLVWVAMSTPKQEIWMAAVRSRLNAPVLLGVGAAFDMRAGILRSAPPLMQRMGLEWLYRLRREPRRLSRRYGRIIPRFIIEVIRDPPRVLSDATST